MMFNESPRRKQINELVAWGHWFALANILMALIISSGYLLSSPIASTPVSITYMLITWVGHISFITFFGFVLLLLPLCYKVKQPRILKTIGSIIAAIGLALLAFDVLLYSKTGFHITFSSAASSDDNFQPVMGTPYGASLSGAGGSLEVSASYGESNYEESSLSAEELSIQSNIRVFPNPTTYMVNVDLSQLTQGDYQLYLVDLQGKVIYQQTTTEKSIELDMRNYSTGSYVLKVQTKGTQQIDTFQIIKIK